ncbi:hypothetical protein LC612_35340 [Nostoc sp. CHAB 5834]|nr:hypothetical protein [Nostoc sp. CHAB 5834]
MPQTVFSELLEETSGTAVEVKPRVDVMGRILRISPDHRRWWSGPQDIPVGSMVRCHGGIRQVFIVVGYADTNHPEKGLLARVLDPLQELPHQPEVLLPPELVEVFRLGDGTVTAGKDYPLTSAEKARLVFAATDLSYQGYSNMATWNVAFKLMAIDEHRRKALSWVRSDGTVSEIRLQSYCEFRLALLPELQYQYPEGCPHIPEFKLPVIWSEVARTVEFEHVAELGLTALSARADEA